MPTRFATSRTTSASIKPSTILLLSAEGGDRTARVQLKHTPGIAAAPHMNL
ncbi:hypothetical protein EKD04_020675 [Chloroflexales bacterium ZM16-3]|nr:hypothetical protein [Chloroflexales bacterium ZM16-3]